jgi:hypothetical protein
LTAAAANPESAKHITKANANFFMRASWSFVLALCRQFIR